jgi:glutathione reductase (NADPH)
MTQTSAFDYDLIVIGAGSGGVRAARIAAGLGRKVAIIEKDKVGGTCVIRGCVPKKLFAYAAAYSKSLRAASAFGWDIQATFDWKTLKANKDAEIERLNRIYLQLLADSGVTLHRGHGKLCGPHCVEVDGRKLSGEHILIATGSHTVCPDIPGIELAIDSNGALDMAALPKNMAIKGGGYIAVEFASIFNGLGVDVHLIYRNDPVLRGFDMDVRIFAQQAFRDNGIDVINHADVMAVKAVNGQKELSLSNGQTLLVDEFLCATGRRANTENLGLHETGVALREDGKILVNPEQQTSVPSIYAVGDVCNDYNLTPVAIKEGHYLAERLFGGGCRYPEYDNLPTAVFSTPEIASCGLTEEQAKAECGEIKVFTSTFRPMKYAMSDVPDKTFIKLIVDKASDKVVGLHIAGLDAAEILQGFAAAMKAGITKERLDATIGIHPTSAEEIVTLRG